MDIEYITRREFEHLVEGIVALEKRVKELEKTNAALVLRMCTLDSEDMVRSCCAEESEADQQ